MEQPTFRILPRPCAKSADHSSQFTKPQTTVKTLEQREAAYAAARRRIMGPEALDADPEGSFNGGPNSSTLIGDQTGVTRSTNHSTRLVATSAPPLMSFQPTPVTVSTVASELAVPFSNPANITQGRESNTSRQGLAVVNVGHKLQQHQRQSQCVTNEMCPMTQQRVLPASASSPSFFAAPHVTQSIPMFHSQVGATNVGLLPTPPGFNGVTSNTVLSEGLQNYQYTAAVLAHYAKLVQHYQASARCHNLLSIPNNHPQVSLNPSPATSQPMIGQKHTHPSTFH